MATDGRPDPGDPVVGFDGEHRAGIATNVQGHLHFASFDATTTDRNALVELLKKWTAAARDMVRGSRVGGAGLPPGGLLAPPTDTARHGAFPRRDSR